MSSLTQLNTNQLNKMFTETQAELKRRENIDKARKEVKAVLKKFKITVDDLGLGTNIKRKISKKTTAVKNIEKKGSTKKLTLKNALPKAS